MLKSFGRRELLAHLKEKESETGRICAFVFENQKFKRIRIGRVPSMRERKSVDRRPPGWCWRTGSVSNNLPSRSHQRKKYLPRMETYIKLTEKKIKFVADNFQWNVEQTSLVQRKARNGELEWINIDEEMPASEIMEVIGVSYNFAKVLLKLAKQDIKRNLRNGGFKCPQQDCDGAFAYEELRRRHQCDFLEEVVEKGSKRIKLEEEDDKGLPSASKTVGVVEAETSANTGNKIGEGDQELITLDSDSEEDPDTVKVDERKLKTEKPEQLSQKSLEEKSDEGEGGALADPEAQTKKVTLAKPEAAAKKEAPLVDLFADEVVLNTLIGENEEDKKKDQEQALTVRGGGGGGERRPADEEEMEADLQGEIKSDRVSKMAAASNPGASGGEADDEEDELAEANNMGSLPPVKTAKLRTECPTCQLMVHSNLSVSNLRFRLKSHLVKHLPNRMALLRATFGGTINCSYCPMIRKKMQGQEFHLAAHDAEFRGGLEAMEKKSRDVIEGRI